MWLDLGSEIAEMFGELTNTLDRQSGFRYFKKGDGGVKHAHLESKRPEAIKLSVTDASERTIAKRLGISRRMVAKFVGEVVDRSARVVRYAPRTRSESQQTKRATALALRTQRLSEAAIAKRLGVCEATVARWLKDAGAPRVKFFKTKDTQREQALALRAQGLPFREIAQRVGVNRSTVTRWFSSANAATKVKLAA